MDFPEYRRNGTPIPGYTYWVRWGDKWRAAEYDEDGFWWFTGTEVPKRRPDVESWEGPIKPP
jgi:hypothetical protein